MMLVEETAVPQIALPVAAFKEHLRLGSGFADDDLQDAVLVTYLRAAIAAVEARTGKILIERSFSWLISSWQDAYDQRLPVAPISAISSFMLETAEGVQTAFSPAGWRLMPDSQTPRLVARAGVLPTIPQSGRARITFLAGYGPEWIDLPADLAQAVLMLAAHFYEYRSDGPSTRYLPNSVSALIDRYRAIRLSLGRGRP